MASSTDALGFLCLSTATYVIDGYVAADGSSFPTAQNTALAGVLGTEYGPSTTVSGQATCQLPAWASVAPTGARALVASVGTQPPQADPTLGILYQVACDSTTLAAYQANGWAVCDGRTLSISANQALYSLLGTKYGGNGVSTFGLPALVAAGSAPTPGVPVPMLALQGFYATQYGYLPDFIGRIIYSPANWVSGVPACLAVCNGQLLPIQSNTALFNLIHTTYGGDGKNTFGLPNLVGASSTPKGLTPYIYIDGVYPVSAA